MDRPFPAYKGDEPYLFVCYTSYLAKQGRIPENARSWPEAALGSCIPGSPLTSAKQTQFRVHPGLPLRAHSGPPLPSRLLYFLKVVGTLGFAANNLSNLTIYYDKLEGLYNLKRLKMMIPHW